jgi:hypothetical protein
MSLNNGINGKREKIKDSTNRVVVDYSDLDGLDDVFTSIWKVTGSKNFKDFIKNIKRIFKYFLESKFSVVDVSSDLIDEFPQIKYIKDVYSPGRFYYLMPEIFKGKVTLAHYDGLANNIFEILAYNDKVNHSDVFYQLYKTMSLLNNFDKDISFNNPDKEYFMKLKELKFDKNAKKLLSKIYKIYDKYRKTYSDEVFDEDPDAGYPSTMGHFIGNSWKALIFLCGCSAVSNGRDVVIFDDVICAFKTYFKLLDLINKD